MFALIDGNSFYASCERAFDPTLRGKPLVVLSNNDGCVITRTQEAKDLGVKMGEPWHLAKKRAEFKTVIVKSSNYALYGDMSRRMYQVILDYSPQVEPYSIDEMFIYLKGMEVNYVEWGLELRRRVRQYAKIPTCVGIGKTKTIAKAANAWAKMDRTGNGVCDFSNDEVRNMAFAVMPLDKVWGIGRASVKKLNALGIMTVSDFIAMPDDQVKDMLTVTGLRTKKELQCMQCHNFSFHAPPKKSLACTRSFGRAITEWEEMRQAVITYVSKAAEKLRKNNLAGAAMQVFMHTNKFNNDPSYANQLTIQIEPTDDSIALIKSAVKAARQIFKAGYRYSKAGVIFVDIYRKQEVPLRMFSTVDPEKSAKLMNALDGLNLKYGRNSLAIGVLPEMGRWSMKRESLSPCYTTQFEDILSVHSI